MSRGPMALMLVLALTATADELVLRHPTTGDPDGRNEFQVEVLTALLEATLESHGPYRLVAVENMPQSREIDSLIHGRWHDVIWTVTNAEREERMRPVRFPLLRGLLGHRVCFVRRDDPMFSSGRFPSRDELVIGQALTWPDTAIFRANGFRLEPGSDYLSTLRMLLAGRTNCFPRGLSEIDIELAAYGSDDLAVEPGVAFLYFAPMYFFVAPDREPLAERIKTGLIRIAASGEFKAIYTRHFDAEGLLARYHMAERSIICLDNPAIDPAGLAAQRVHMIDGPGTFADECMGREAAADAPIVSGPAEVTR